MSISLFLGRYNHISMRAGIVLCERDCKDGQLDYPLLDGFLSNTKGPSLETPWGEGTFGPAGYRFSTGQGLTLSEGRCVKGVTYTIYIKASLDSTTGWKRVIGTESWGDNGIFVNTFFQTFPVSFWVEFLDCNLLMQNIGRSRAD